MTRKTSRNALCAGGLLAAALAAVAALGYAIAGG